MNENQHIDLRIIKTKESIKEAFQCIIKEKNFSKITVTNIIEKARINRSTFYKYYEDKYELRDVLLSETLTDFSNKIDLSLFNFEDYEKLKDYDVRRHKGINHFNYMLKNKEWYLALWNRNMEAYVYEDMQQILENKLKTSINQNINSSKYELFIRMCASCAMKNLQWWYDYSDQISVEEMIDMNSKFFNNMYNIMWPKIN